MGIEAVKSSTPAPCREKIKEALKIIINGDEKMLNTFIQEFREEFMELTPEEIAFPRSCNGIKKFTGESSLFASGAPMHVKGSILYNHLIRKNKLSGKYPYIQEGDKVLRDFDMQVSIDSLEYLNTEMSDAKLLNIKSSINQMILSQMQTKMMTQLGYNYVVKIIVPPFIPLYPSRPSRRFIALIGLLSGLIVGVLLVLMRQYIGFNITKQK